MQKKCLQQEDYEITLDNAKKLTLLLASDASEYGGTKTYKDADREMTLKKHCAVFSLSPHSAVYYKIS